jgi:hypothetical protein
MLGYMQSEASPALEAPLPPGTTRADIWTGRFCLSADIPTGDRRLLDLMRDVTRNYVDVRRVRVAPVDAPEQATEAADGLLTKSEIDCVAVRAEPSRAASRLYGFVKKTPVRVLLVLASQTIRGSVFVESMATDPVTYFFRGIEKSSERFLAVGSASISLQSGRTEETGLAIVNRGAVRLFSVIR